MNKADITLPRKDVEQVLEHTRAALEDYATQQPFGKPCAVRAAIATIATLRACIEAADAPPVARVTAGIATEDGIRWQAGAWSTERTAVTVDGHTWYRHDDQKVASGPSLSFAAFRAANVARCLKWHPKGIESWSPSDWLTAVTGELGELASLLKMRNRERDGLAGNKFSPTDKQVADELADVLTYLDLLAAALGVNLGRAAALKFNEVSERVGFPDRIEVTPTLAQRDGAAHG